MKPHPRPQPCPSIPDDLCNYSGLTDVSLAFINNYDTQIEHLYPEDEKAWDSVKPAIWVLYMEQNLRLQDVIERMKELKMFHATYGRQAFCGLWYSTSELTDKNSDLPCTRHDSKHGDGINILAKHTEASRRKWSSDRHVRGYLVGDRG